MNEAQGKPQEEMQAILKKALTSFDEALVVSPQEYVYILCKFYVNVYENMFLVQLYTFFTTAVYVNFV